MKDIEATIIRIKEIIMLCRYIIDKILVTDYKSK